MIYADSDRASLEAESIVRKSFMQKKAARLSGLFLQCKIIRLFLGPLPAVEAKTQEAGAKEDDGAWFGNRGVTRLSIM